MSPRMDRLFFVPSEYLQRNSSRCSKPTWTLYLHHALLRLRAQQLHWLAATHQVSTVMAECITFDNLSFNNFANLI